MKVTLGAQREEAKVLRRLCAFRRPQRIEICRPKIPRDHTNAESLRTAAEYGAGSHVRTAMKRSNTSLERSRPCGVKRIDISLCSPSIPFAQFGNGFAKIRDRVFSELPPQPAEVNTAVQPQTQKECLFERLRPMKLGYDSAALRQHNASSESGAENRTASTPRSKPGSIECASTPKPRYGCRVQYFRLWRDSYPCRAKLEISYCRTPAASSRSQAINTNPQSRLHLAQSERGIWYRPQSVRGRDVSLRPPQACRR